MRLTAIRNGPKQTIFASGGFRRLEVVLEPDIEQCANENTGPKGGGLWDPTWVKKENDAFLIRVWKPLPSRSWRRYVTSQSEQYLLAVSFGRYRYIYLFKLYTQIFCNDTFKKSHKFLLFSFIKVVKRGAVFVLQRWHHVVSTFRCSAELTSPSSSPLLQGLVPPPPITVQHYSL